MMRSKKLLITIIFIVSMLLCYAMFKIYVSQPLSELRTPPDYAGARNSISMSVADIGIARNELTKLNNIKDIKIENEEDKAVVLIYGEHREELVGLLLKECHKIGKVLTYSLSEGFEAPREHGVIIDISFIKSDSQN